MGRRKAPAPMPIEEPYIHEEPPDTGEYWVYIENISDPEGPMSLGKAQETIEHHVAETDTLGDRPILFLEIPYDVEVRVVIVGKKE